MAEFGNLGGGGLPTATVQFQGVSAGAASRTVWYLDGDGKLKSLFLSSDDTFSVSVAIVAPQVIVTYRTFYSSSCSVSGAAEIVSTDNNYYVIKVTGDCTIRISA